MKNQGSNLADCGWQTRSVLTCGSPLPLWVRPVTSQGALESARGLAQSNTWQSFVAAFAFLATVIAGSAQNHSIDWHTIDGGGGTNTGGPMIGIDYSVSGTIGQPDAGRMSGGNHTIDGGFWGIIAAVQTTGAPLLSIARTTANNVTVFWPSPSTGFVLQQNTNSIAPQYWINMVTLPSDDGTTRTVIVHPPTGDRFYRLFKP